MNFLDMSKHLSETASEHIAVELHGSDRSFGKR